MNVHVTDISVVIPVYKAESCIEELYKRLESSLSSITENFEIVLVEDSGKDGTWEIIKRLAARDSRLKGIMLSRNFGQHYAITAGLDYCHGEWVVVMDCDLQDQPEEIPRLYAKAKEGFDIVFARRANRKDDFIKKLCSRVFYVVFDYLTDQKSDPSIANFGIFNSKVIDNFRSMRESARNFPLFVRWLGFNSTAIDIEHSTRHTVHSSYTIRSAGQLAINSIMAQSNKPLYLSIKFGFFMALGSILFAIYLTTRYFIYSSPVQGWTSVIVSIYFLFGLLFINTGFVGLYIGRIYNEVKNRPIYVVDQNVNLENSLNSGHINEN